MTTKSPNLSPVTVIGAGLSGLMAARDLASAGLPVRIVEKARSVGGRLATRRIGAATLDHGAQFFTVRDETFAADVDHWLSDGVVEVWCEGFAEIDGYPRYRTVGGMSQLAKYLARDRNIVTGVRAQSIIPSENGWVVTYEGAVREPDDAAAVVATAPVPQTLELLASGGIPLGDHQALADIAYHRVIALLATTGVAVPLDAPGALQQPDDPTFSFVADNQAKGISSDPAVTFHTAHALSAQLWQESDQHILDRLLAPAAAAIGLSVDDFGVVQVKRWRYSGPVNPWPERAALVRDSPAPLVACGDAFGGPKMEGAYLSGRAAAQTIIEALGV